MQGDDGDQSVTHRGLEDCRYPAVHELDRAGGENLGAFLDPRLDLAAPNCAELPVAQGG